MTTQPDGSPGTVTVEVVLDGDGWQLRAGVPVPAGPTRVGDLLPLARAISDAVVGETVRSATRAGEQVPCRAGCAACCRYLITISEIEARRLRAVVDGLPGPDRDRVCGRVAAARDRLAAAGLLEPLERPETWTPDEYHALARAYLDLGLACPFLENESCSIYPERPIACREHLVTSAAEHCARPTPETFRRLRIPLPVANAVARWQVRPSDHILQRWVPLALALDWADAHPDGPQPAPGPDLLTELIGYLKERDELEGEPT
jgi:Fe-S-cluster containining protein